MAWGPGLHCCWAFVHQTSPKLGCEIVEVGWDFCFCPQRPNSLPGAGPSTGALLKVAFICAGIVDVRSKLSLSEQLLRTFGGGFELHTWSELPHGSGLGEWGLSACCPLTPSPPSSLTSDPPPQPLPSGEGVSGAGQG